MKILKNNWIQLEKYGFVLRNILKNHIPHITQTPQKMENAGGFYGKTREMPLSSEIGKIYDFQEVKIFENGI